MSTSLATRLPRKLKLTAEQGIPSLDNFPDALLQHILSYLPTKYSVRTSILSRRWRFLWTYVSNLDFQEEEDGSPTKRRHFMNFVERVLLFHDISCTKRFSLSCNVGDDASRVNAWISAALWRNAEELDIRLTNVKDNWILPLSLFKSDKVKVLKLDIDCDLKLPTQINLSSLKMLILRNCTFVDDFSTQLLFLCPTLEKLVLDQCNWLHLPDLIISAPNLWSLTICEMDEETWRGPPSMLEGDSCEVMIHGTGLVDFNYTGTLLGDYRLCTTSKISNASFNVPSYSKKSSEAAAKTIFKLLKKFADVKNLKLSTNAIQVLNNATELFASLPVFDNLTCLSLGPDPADLCCTALHTILKNFPCVESLILAEVDQSYILDRLLHPELTSFLSHIKRIEVGEFKGEEEELFVMQILLLKAIVLETLVVYFVGDPALRRETEFLLSILPRGSKSSDLVFI